VKASTPVNVSVVSVIGAGLLTVNNTN
jgi:hypothetical protein